ncbi:sulfurtransferase [Virgibacillus sp. W0181]|uniref:sulfurtransferase n=1 Tax=Virgibacillus sp. W0181 TaxID=3391581 RepID=UPI003F488292
MSYIVTESWLKDKLNEEKADIAVLDVRFNMGDPEAGRQAYLKSHIPEAFFLDIDTDLSGKVEKHGGNHPLPNMDTLAEKLGSIGIDKNTTIVIYDGGSDMFAARAWWILHYMGHEDVYVLEGGWKSWLAAGNEVTDVLPERTQKVFHPNVRKESAVHMEDVREKMREKSAILLDSRSADRYAGRTEPLYTKAGHIPGAKNYFWKNVLHSEGNWKSKEQLEDYFSDLPKDEEIIVSCGSGISACPNILGLKMAGYTNVKLYPGSFSDWISYDENDLETKEE